MTGTDFADASCYHAAFAVLLTSMDESADPVAMLGANASTGARLDTDGLLVFDDPLEVLSLVLVRAERPLARHRVDGAPTWATAERALAAGRPVAAAADPFHLRYFWPAYGQSHDLHTVVLRDLDVATDTVRLLDAGEEVFFDGRVPLAEVRAAMYGEDRGQSWVEAAWNPQAPTTRSASPSNSALPRIVAELTGATGRWLSGRGLVEALTERLDDYLRAVRDRPRPQSVGPAPELGRSLPLGLLWYHHTLRWLARWLAMPGRPRIAAQTVERAARDLVVANGLMMRLGVLDPNSPRAAAFRRELDSRLASVAHDVTTTGNELASRTGAAA
ncbi:hypothetical protein [Streptomyces prasinopilosus]|uniref:Butirosin biosynthesis protein H, N-terminal n=1 Tax=Streptomyces prasinopilosus TaxID=67344 RepID=A0A1G6M2L6_9ACTN|nr:hypothetical protein [Streptomyces prasinopilosus]SDC49597.1 hypothetical protein SAMN05216505_102353 [Streptomyces prasinopilosus]